MGTEVWRYSTFQAAITHLALHVNHIKFDPMCLLRDSVGGYRVITWWHSEANLCEY